jgi:hypothetical protein
MKASSSALAQVEILARYEQPLGYGVLKPVDGKSLDAALVEAWNALGVRSGDVVRLTLVRLTPGKEGR